MSSGIFNRKPQKINLDIESALRKMVRLYKMSMVECILVKPNRISDYRDRTRDFITRTFDRLNYKDLVSIFQSNL